MVKKQEKSLIDKIEAEIWTKKNQDKKYTVINILKSFEISEKKRYFKL